jgi:hypothetical protein
MAMNKLKQNTESAFPTAMGEGMTLRDYFAAKAMQAILHANMRAAGGDGSVSFDLVAAAAYRMADAMIRARGAA